MAIVVTVEDAGAVAALAAVIVEASAVAVAVTNHENRAQQHQKSSFNMKIVFSKIQDHTVCPGSSDPFYVVTYYLHGALLPGHIVRKSVLKPCADPWECLIITFYLKIMLYVIIRKKY